jgi:hypothetical protein
MRAAIDLTLLLSLTLASSARADWIRLLPGNVGPVVANAGYAAVLRDGEVWLFRDDGSVAGRLAERADAAAGAARRTAQREAEEILDFFDVAESEREEDWALDLVYDERTLVQRRRARAPSPFPGIPSPPPALAAGAGHIWIGSRHGLLRVGPAGEVMRFLAQGGPATELLAAGARVAVGMSDGYRFFPTKSDQESVLPLPVHRGKTALSTSGQRWAYATSAGITRAGAPPRVFAPGSPILDFTYCGETLVVLLADGLAVMPEDAAAETRGLPPAAKRIACPEGESGPWLASGRRLSLSFDQGRQWRTVETPADLELTAVAMTAHHLWLASPQGLFFSLDGSQPAPRPTRPAATASPRRSSSWLSWLPKVSLRAAAVTAPTGRALEALAYATIPLDPRRLPFLATAVDEVIPPAADPVAERAPDQRDPDQHCLMLARRQAVERALAEPERAAAYLTRAGRAAWLPELRLLVSRRYGRSESLDVATSATALSSPLGIDTVNDIRYEARATWDLGRLVFSAEELAAQTQALHMAELRRDIESTVNRLYFERRRLALDARGTDASPRGLRASELDAELDSLTGGGFGACIAPASHPRK